MPLPHVVLRLLASTAISVPLLIGPANAQAARPVLNAAPGCEAGVTEAYNTGYLNGVEAVKAQLAQATAQVQSEVQAQLNEQLARMQAHTAAELDTRIAAAQNEALSDQAKADGDARMPSLSGTMQALDARAAPVAVGSATGSADASAPADPAALPPGTTITIHDPQSMPPELYQALMAYVGT